MNTPETQSGGSLEPVGWAAKKDIALWNWMQDITSLVCYQPEVPMKHKESLCAAMARYTGCRSNLQATQPPNARGEQPAPKANKL
jgi:hypothetical protein